MKLFRNNGCKSVTSTLALVLLATSASSAHAQSAQEGAAVADEERGTGSLLDEIVVTAQKRGQKAQDVGIAITALSGEQLSRTGTIDSISIARLSSNVSVSGSYAGQMSQFTIRGVTQNDFNDHVESVIAVYIDDTYVASQQGQTFSLFDVDRVEVLKGPQGTLFGRNATGGLAQFYSRRPTRTFEGYVNATYASYDNVRLEGALSGPLSEGLRVRVSGMYESYNGYIKNQYPQETYVPAALVPGLNSGTLPGTGADLGGVKANWALRGQISADIAPGVDLWVSAFYGKSTASTGNYQQVPTVAVLDAAGNHINTFFSDASTNPLNCVVIQAGACTSAGFNNLPGATRPRAGADFSGYLDPDGSGPLTSSDYTFDDANTLKTYGASAKLSIDIDGVNLISITDYKHFNKDFSLDLEAGPQNQFFWHGVSASRSITQELRLDGKTDQLNWVVGLYYLNIDNHSVHGIGALPDSGFPIASWDQPRVANLKTKSFSLFGQVEYKLSDTLTAIGGLRWSREKKDYDYEVLFVFPNNAGNPRGWDYAPSIAFPGFSQALYTAYDSQSLWSWKAQLNWKPSDDVLVYAGVTQGAKAASYNAGGPPLAAANIPYKAEKLISYEAGFKSSLLDRRLRFNASAFYYDYSSYQAARWLGFSSLIINADAYIYGAEAELTASLAEGLEGSFNIGVQRNQVNDVPVAGTIRDVHTTFAPELTLAGTLRYTVPAKVADGSLAFQADGNYQSRVWQNLNNFNANKLSAFAIFNARVDWTNASDSLTLSFFVKNIANRYYDVIGFDLSQICGCNLQAQGKPRWIGGSAQFKF